MSAEIIKVLDYLCTKFGVVIDWTAENVWPQVLDFIGRYQTYAVTKHCISMVLAIIISVFCCIIFKKMSEIDLDGCDIFIQGVCIIGIFVCAAIFITNIFSAVEWGIVPEIKFIEILSTYMD